MSDNVKLQAKLDGGPAAKVPKNKYTASELEAAQLAKYSRFIQASEGSETQVGVWYNIPPGFEAHHFVRFTRRDPHMMEQAAILQAIGYENVKNIKGGDRIRYAGAESDGDDRLYLCASPALRAKKLELERMARKNRGRALSRDFGDEVAALVDMVGAGNVKTTKKTREIEVPIR